MSENNSAIILGAGPSGLITAWKLVEAGWDVSIIEKKNITGGLCRSWKYKNFIIDTGPHIFHTPEKLLKNFGKKILKTCLLRENLVVKMSKEKILINIYDYPLSIEGLNQIDKNLKKKL
jgi:protoporphyrinogen oxidase